MDFKFCTKIGVYSSSSSQLNLGKEDLGIRNISAVFSLSWRKKDTSRLVSKWECFRLSALTSIEDDSSSSQFKSSQTDNNTLYHHLSQGFTFLPRPLSATNNSSLFKDNAAKMRIVYKGVPGAFGEVAALQAYPLCQAVPCENFEAAFKAVELCLADKAILPIENSKSGSFHRNYDLLLRHKLHIVAEVQMVINHCLLGLPGVKKEELKRVLSNTLAFAQCEVALSSLNIVKEGVDCTSGAAQIVASKSRRDTGAVASSRAAEIYGLNILAEKIQDDSDNITRFLVLERQPIIPKTDVPYKTSIVFNSEEGPGVVFKVLTVFANRDINLTKIESRPQRKQPLRVVDNSKNGNSTYFDYIFYIDVEASLAEPRMQLALRHLQEFTTFVKVLGSYPTDSRLL